MGGVMNLPRRVDITISGWWDLRRSSRNREVRRRNSQVSQRPKGGGLLCRPGRGVALHFRLERHDIDAHLEEAVAAFRGGIGGLTQHALNALRSRRIELPLLPLEHQ